MTNLTDEGLDAKAKELFLKAVEPYADGAIDMDFAEVVLASALKQVRDAAKKETVEACAKVADGMNYAPNSGFGRGAKDIAKAIRHIGTTNEMGKA